MADIMAQQGVAPAAPSSRQDVVSALLSDYGNSFGNDDVSNFIFPPLPADKDVPPPPPRVDSLRNWPLPSVQRAEQRMSATFQLRALEDAALSTDSARNNSPEQRPRRKILYRSLSREAKPPSLNLVTSNGSTAIVPPTPDVSIRAQTLPVSSNLDHRELHLPPPPPPLKSERRSNAPRAAMGLRQSKSHKDLTRSDSLLFQDDVQSIAMEAMPAVTRKGLAGPVARKFRSLVELGTGPRGGRGGPLPLNSATSKISIDSQVSSASQDEAARVKMPDSKSHGEQQQRDPPPFNRLPPTPEMDRFAAGPTQPRRVSPALGLPSNPRAKGRPMSPRHVQGKSDTGFSLLKAHRPAPPIPSTKVGTITPEMTPSPTLKPQESREQEISPLLPNPPSADPQRPFRFEPLSVAKSPAKAAQQQRAKPAAPFVAPQVYQAYAPPTYSLRTTTLNPPSPSPTLRPSTAPAPTSKPEPTATPPIPTEEASSPPLPPFTPLTRAPIVLAVTYIPAITPAQLHCYTAHKTNVWSNNIFQPMGCMICHKNGRDRKWACTWCQLRICKGCSDELRMVPGRNLGKLLKERKRIEEEEAEEKKNKDSGEINVEMLEVVHGSADKESG